MSSKFINDFLKVESLVTLSIFCNLLAGLSSMIVYLKSHENAAHEVLVTDSLFGAVLFPVIAIWSRYVADVWGEYFSSTKVADIVTKASLLVHIVTGMFFTCYIIYLFVNS